MKITRVRDCSCRNSDAAHGVVSLGTKAAQCGNLRTVGNGTYPNYRVVDVNAVSFTSLLFCAAARLGILYTMHERKISELNL